MAGRHRIEVERSVYVDPAARGRGVGRTLVEALIASTEAAGIWTIQSGVFPESSRSHARTAPNGPWGLRGSPPESECQIAS